MGKEDSSYKPIGARNLPPSTNPAEPHNHANSAFQGNLVWLDGPNQQPYLFEVAEPVEIFLFSHDYPVRMDVVSDYFISDEESGRRSYPETIIDVDADSGQYLFGGSQMIVPDDVDLSRRQVVKGSTITNGLRVTGYYVTLFLRDRNLTSGGEPIPCTLHMGMTSAAPQIHGPQPGWFQGDAGPDLEWWQTVLLLESQYTQEIRDNNDVLVAPNPFFGTDYLIVVGLFNQIESGQIIEGLAGNGGNTPRDYYAIHPLYLASRS